MADDACRGWAARLRALLPWFGAPPRDATGKRLPKPFVRRYGRYTSLQFTRRQTQSRMLTESPDVLLIDYTRTMLGALLLRPDPTSIGMVGLGGGSQAKFCYRHLPKATIEVVENNPHVIRLRRRFDIPPDDGRLRVFLDDGARFLHGRCARYDLLLVDGYDERGIPAPLATQRFYDDCHQSLSLGGVAAFNLFCADSDEHVMRLRRSFGASRVRVVEEARMSNRVAFAWTGTPPPASAARQRALDALAPAARAELEPVFARVAQALDA